MSGRAVGQGGGMASPGRIIRWLAKLAVGTFVLGALIVGAGWGNRVIHNRATARLPTELFVRQAGVGEEHVVLLHGLVASSSYWAGVANALEDRFHLIMPDLLGFGASPWPSIEYTLDDHLDALAATLDQVAPNARFSIVAHSMGTQLAVAYAIRYPQRVSKLVLVGPPLFHSREEAIAKSRRSSPVLSMMSFSPVLAPVICAVHEAGRPLLRPLMPFWLPELPPAVAGDAVQHTWDSFLGSLDHVVLGVDLESLVQELHGVPILILQGDHDDNASPEDLQRLASEAGGQFVRLKGDHNFLLQHPEPVLGMIRSFLAENAS